MTKEITNLALAPVGNLETYIRAAYSLSLIHISEPTRP